jgi:hypothetical protein
MRILSILLVLALIGVVGCTQQASEGTGDQQAVTTKEEAPAKTEAVAAMAVNVGDELTLTGTAGCGHCNFHIAESCAMAMQVADGTIFLLDGIGEDTEAFNQRTKGMEITVIGKVTEAGDANRLAVDSYEM